MIGIVAVVVDRATCYDEHQCSDTTLLSEGWARVPPVCHVLCHPTWCIHAHGIISCLVRLEAAEVWLHIRRSIHQSSGPS